MPTFELTLSDGRKFHVDAADQDAAQRDLLAHVSPQQKGGPIDAVRQGAANLLGGVGQTNKVLFGGGDQMATAGANAIAPKNQADTTLYDDKGLHLENLGNNLAESAPAMGASMLAARAMPGPWWAKAGAAAAVGAYTMFGAAAKDAAAKRTGDANATPNTDDMLSATKRVGPEAVIQAAPMGGLAARAAASSVLVAWRALRSAASAIRLRWALQTLAPTHTTSSTKPGPSTTFPPSPTRD